MNKNLIIALVVFLIVVVCLLTFPKGLLENNHNNNNDGEINISVYQSGESTAIKQEGMKFGSSMTVEDIKKEYVELTGKDDKNKYLFKPFYNVEQTTEFNFTFRSNVDPVKAVTVHTDSKCDYNSMVNQINDGYRNAKGTAVIVKPGRMPVLGAEARKDLVKTGIWGYAPVYYLCIRYDLDSKEVKELGEPIVIPFTIKNKISTPNAFPKINSDGTFEVEWLPVDGAVSYNVYAKVALYNGKAKEYTREEVAYISDETMKLIKTVSADKNSYSDEDCFIYYGDESTVDRNGKRFVGSQNKNNTYTYYVTAVDKDGNESFFSKAICDWKYQEMLPLSAYKFITNLTAFPDTVTVQMLGPTKLTDSGFEYNLQQYPINFYKVGEPGSYIKSCDYEYEIVGTRLTGKCKYTPASGDEYPEEVISKFELKAGLRDDRFPVIPDVNVPTLQDKDLQELPTDLGKKIEYPEEAKIPLDKTALVRRADCESARYIDGGVYPDSLKDISTYVLGDNPEYIYVNENGVIEVVKASEYKPSANAKTEEELVKEAEENAKQKAEREQQRIEEEKQIEIEKAKIKAEQEAQKQIEEAKKKAEEEAKKQIEEAKRKAEEEAQKQIAEQEEARRKAEEEAQRLAEELKKAQEEQQKAQDEEARRKAREEAIKAEEAIAQAEEEERQARVAKRKAQKDAEEKAEEARRKAEEEAKKKAEEARKKAEEEAERKAEEEKKKLEEEAKKKAEEAAKKAEEDRQKKIEDAKKTADEDEQKRIEEAKKEAEEEAEKEAELAKKKAEAEAQKKAQEEKKKADEEAQKKIEEAKKAEEEAKQKAKEEAEKKAKEEEEAEAKLKEAQEKAKQAKDEEEKKKAEEEKKKAEEARKKAEEERKKAEEAAKKAEEEAKKKAEEEAKKAEEEAKKKAEEEAKKAEEEAERKAEEAAKKAEEEAKKAAEEAERKAQEQKEQEEDPPTSIDGSNVVDEQRKDTEQDVIDANKQEVLNTKYPITADNAAEKYLAIQLINQVDEIDLKAFPELLNMETLADYLDFVWYQNEYIMGFDLYKSKLSNDGFFLPHYFHDDATAQKYQEAVYNKVSSVNSKIIKSGMNDNEKVYAIYDYLGEHGEYNHKAYEDSISGKIDDPYEVYPNCWNTYGILCEELGVCQSYAYAFNALARAAGLDSLMCCGTMSGGGHAWNVVSINGKWCMVDATNQTPPHWICGSSSNFITKNNFVVQDGFVTGTGYSSYSKYVSNYDDSNEYYKYNKLTFTTAHELAEFGKKTDGKTVYKNLSYTDINTLIENAAKEIMEAGNPAKVVNVRGWGTEYVQFITK